MKEIERKYLITCTQYESIYFQLKELYPCSLLEQTNYYYDSDSYMLFRQNDTLRARERNGKLEMQYKFNKIYTNEERCCDEVCWPINSLPLTISTFLLAKYNKKLDGNVEKFSVLGALKTKRTNFLINNLLFSLDKNFYLGCIDYELEIEGVLKENTSFVNSICTDLGVRDIESSNKSGKYKRFLSRYFDIKEHYSIYSPFIKPI